jgi:hypothetical protein
VAEQSCEIVVLRLRWVPRILFACRVSILSGLAGIVLFLLISQARDLFADISFGALPGKFDSQLHWFLFFSDLVLIWAFPVHYAARWMLEQNDWMFSRRVRGSLDPRDIAASEAAIRADLKNWIDWVPRILGMLPFLAVLIGLWKTYDLVAKTQSLEPSFETSRQVIILTVCTLFVAALFMIFLVIRRPMIAKFEARRSAATRSLIRIDIFTLVAIVSALAITFLFLCCYFDPAFAADIAPRAVIVPCLFGSTVFIGTFLAWGGDRVGFPLLLTAITAALALTAWNSHFNDIRLIACSGTSNFADRQIDLDEAIAKWKIANRCDETHCPPALIIAAEGGASRAAFAAATAIGELLDRASALTGNPGMPARRIFAISGVSGGAFGAAVIRTALWEALEHSESKPPCRMAPRNWFAESKEDVTKSWRACLQALVSGDFLTPAFVGLGFRDNISPREFLFFGSSFLTDDRAALVEEAWERHFDQVIAGIDPQPISQALLDLTFQQEPQGGLHRPFGYVSEKLKNDSWLPLLILNSTSVNTGTRVLVSDLISTTAVQNDAQLSDPAKGHPLGREALYPAAFDVFEMLSTPCQKTDADFCIGAHQGTVDNPLIRNGPDIRLSTAAMLSARFPIVSPAGIIRALGAELTGDRAVDGGYFENTGLTTALDIARAIRKRSGITPIVLWIQNDPSSSEGDPKDVRPPPFPPRAAGTPPLGTADPMGPEALFGILATPLNALTATRQGHSMQEDVLAQHFLESLNSPLDKNERGPNYFTFKAYKYPQFNSTNECPALPGKVDKQIEMSDVSMSWWLSQSVQAEVDSQLCDARNRQSLADLMVRLSQSLTMVH